MNPRVTTARCYPAGWSGTFAWLGRNRDLSKDYEALQCTEDAWAYLAMIRLMLARKAR